MDYTIRRADASDAGRIQALFIQMLQTIYARDDVQGYESGYLDKFFYTNDNLIYVAESEGMVIAFLSIEEHLEEDVPFIYLDDFSVADGYRSHGIGTELLCLAEQYAMEHDFRTIFLHVEASNVRALKLYENLGYRKYEVTERRIKMRKLVDFPLIDSEKEVIK